MNAQSKNQKLTKMLLGLGILVGMLITSASISTSRHLSTYLFLILFGFGLTLMMVCLMPTAYEDWTGHGKSKRVFISIMVIFILGSLLPLVIGLWNYFTNSH